MKPECPDEGSEDQGFPPVAGDVIGDTAYSERFVLKILLKLANLDTLKEEIKEQSFHDDLCVLWDMTAERDVVLFLQKHDVLKLFNFALPIVESIRLIEIIIGIIANMCCQKEVVPSLMEMDTFLAFLLGFFSSDDSSVLTQLLRLVNSCLFLSEGADAVTWMDLFIKVEYSKALYFMLKNSTNKDLLVTAFENFNTVSSYCITETCREKFFTHFVTLEALDSLAIAFLEIFVNHKDQFVQEELERILIISFQLVLYLVGFDVSYELYSGYVVNLLKMIYVTLTYYNEKLIKMKDLDDSIVDIIESTNAIVKILDIYDVETNMYLEPSYCMWTNIDVILKTEEEPSSFDDDKKDLKDLAEKIQLVLGAFICSYLKKCSDENLLTALDLIQPDFESIVNSVQDEKLKTAVSSRTDKYLTRVNENVDS